MYKTWEELTVLEQLACTYSDMYKDAYGIRPRGFDFSSWTEAEFNRQLDSLQIAIQQRVDEERKFEEAAAKDFEERVQEVLNLGAKDRAAALRWIMDADGANGDWEYLCYLNGLRYGYFSK